MRLWVTNKDIYADTQQAEKFIAEEEAFDYNSFYSNCHAKMLEDTVFLNNLKGKTVFFGAAAKGCVYLNALKDYGFNGNDAYVVDDTPHKQGKFIPGTGMKVQSREFLLADEPDNIVILAHNFAGFITQSLRKDGYKGKVLTLLPSLYIDEASDWVKE